MNCSSAEPLLNAYVDGELAPTQVQRVEQHLGECAACAQQVSELQMLQTALGSEALYHAAPGTLRGRVESALAASQPASVVHPSISTSMAAAIVAGIAFLAAASLVAWKLWPSQPMHSRAEPILSLAEQSVRSHVRAVQANRLTEVNSSHPQVVTTWLQGKLKKTVFIRDLSAQGYTLQGARVESAGIHAIVVLVYAHGSHSVNLYLWPKDCAPEQQSCSMISGYHLANWEAEGVIYWAVSDLPAERLAEFAKLAGAKGK